MIQPDSDEVPDTDGKENSAVELGKTYQFAGYKWTACELINKGKNPCDSVPWGNPWKMAGL